MRKGKERDGGQRNKPLSGKKEGAPASGSVSDESCRCKEVASKTPRELLKLMISDLAFWKKKRPLV